MKFIGIHITNEGIYTSEGAFIESDYFYKLFEICNRLDPVFYDLDGSVASLLHLIGITKEQGQKLLDTTKLFLPPFTLTYYPKHFFSIDYGGGKVHPFLNFANMNQVGYLEARYSEEDNGSKKALEAKQTAQNVCNVFAKLGINMGSIVSPISQFLKKYQLNWPTMDDCPDEVTEMAHNGITGQWFEAYKMGHFPKATDYDINASYLSELAKLPDIRRGTWTNECSDDAILGVADGILTTETEFHPFCKKIHDEYFTPTGQYPYTMTLGALRFLNKWKLGEFKIERGHFWIPKGQQFQCYKGAMAYLWNQRQGKVGREKTMVQRLYSGLWGRQLQRNESGGFGDMFNSLIGLTVETNSRLKVADACLCHGIVPLAVMADGFITDQEINLPLGTNHGEWRLSSQGKCIIAGSGAVAFQGNEPIAELALDYDTLVAQVKEDPTATEYTRQRYSPVTLALALQRDFKDLGKIELLNRTLTIGNDTKRMFLKRPKTGKDLISKQYDSIPHDHQSLLT